MSTDDLMNIAAIAGALAVFVFGGWSLYTLQETIERRIRKMRAPKPVPITFHVGHGPPSPAEWAARKKAEEIKYGQHQPKQ